MKSKKYVTYVKKEFCYDKNEKNKFKLYQKVRDHCHYTGKLRWPAHSICNLRYKVQREIPVIIHNEKIQKNLLLFQYQLKKKMMNLVKWLHTK